jgi:hypothetical protein
MNIDKSRRLQQEVIAKVLQVVAFPQPTEPGEMVSIKYVVPMRAPIELWDGKAGLFEGFDGAKARRPSANDADRG